MNRTIIFLLLFILFICTTGYSQLSLNTLESIISQDSGYITSVSVSPSGSNISVSMNAAQNGQVIIFSLTECAEIRRFNYMEGVNVALISAKDFGTVLIGAGDTLKLVQISTGTELLSEKILGAQIMGIAQSAKGGYVAIWGNNRYVIYDLGSKKQIWSEDTKFPVSGAVLAADGSSAYISGHDGTLMRRELRSSTLNLFDLQEAIQSMYFDSSNRYLFMAFKSGLLKYDINAETFVRVASVPVKDVQVNSKGNYIATMGDNVFYLYTYPDMRLIRSKAFKGSNMALFADGSVITYENGVLYIYDNTRNTDSGRIYVSTTYSGAVSPSFDYYGNNDFVRMLTEGRLGSSADLYANKSNDKYKACSAFFNILTPVYGIKKPEQPAIKTPDVKTPEVKNPSVKSPSNTDTSKTPTVKEPDIKAPLVKEPVSKDVILGPSIPSVESVNKPMLTDGPVEPTVSSVDRLNLMPGNNIPVWVMRPASQAQYSAVRSGTDSAAALKDAKKIIVNDIARTTMKNMLQTEFVRNMQSEELMKKFLWMVGGKTAMMSNEYIIQKDLWISPEGKVYILAHVSIDSINQIYDPIFQEEMDILKDKGVEEYLKREPVKINTD